MFLENLVCALIVHKLYKESERDYDEENTTTSKESVIERFIPKAESIPEQPANTIKMVLGTKKRVIYISP